MILTYEKIRELKQLEKQDKLQELPENFSTAVAEYIDLKKGSDEEVSANNLIKGLYALRKKKIINLACLFYKTHKIPDNINDIEKELYVNMMEVIKKYHNSFDELFKNSSEIEEETLKKENLTSGENKINLKQNNSESNEDNSNSRENEDKQELQNNTHKDELDPSLVKKEIRENLFENNSQKDKLTVVFLSDIPEIVTPTGEICSFKEEEEKELDTDFAIQLKELGFCRFKQ